MRETGQPWLARAIVLGVVIVSAVVLVPELDIARVDLNDSVFHLTIAEKLAERLASGRTVLDFWMPEWSLGFPVVRDYQPLGHWIVVLMHFATFREVPVDVAFTFLRWLLLAIFPLSAYASTRMLGLRPLTAAAVALLSPLVSAPNLYGIDYGSYVWRGNGLYTQLVAMHLFVLAIGLGRVAIGERRLMTLAGAVLGFTFLAHFIYGYMAAATLVLLALMPLPEIPLIRRLARLAWVALVSLAVSAFQIVPMLGDGPFINRSRWEPVWKWESFGVGQVLSLTASGKLLDGGRLPVLSLLALLAVVLVVRRHIALTERHAADFAAAGALFWIFLFCGRAAWAPLFTVLGLSEAAHLHRFVGGVQWFLLILAGIGLARVWSWPFERQWRGAAYAAIALTLVLLWSPVAERRRFVEEGYAWGRENLAAFATHRASIAAVTDDLKTRGGRAYPGLAAKWGAELRVGYVPLYAFLSRAHVPAVAFLYHSMSLPGDLTVRFDETRPEQYRLFDIRSVVAETARVLPAFLRAEADHGPFRIYTPPASTGAFDLVTAPNTYFVDRRTFYDVNDAWLQSGWPAARAHLLLDYENAVAIVPRPRLSHLAPLARPARVQTCGSVRRSSEEDDVYSAAVHVTGSGCFALLKTTFHPDWKATVDGRAVAAVMLSPGFIGVPLDPGEHAIELRYEPGATKGVLLLFGFALAALALAGERRGWFERLEAWCVARASSSTWLLNPNVRWALFTLFLVLPCVVPYAGASQPNGHDVLQYLPRLVEFHENIRHGILLPRWAPDFGHGQGQPLFLLNPPLFYYLGSFFHLIGFGFVAAINASVVLLILASAASMFLLGRWYFGSAGGAIAAIAYVWAPYTLVDLYVRTAFAEFATFPFYPLVIYGFARHAEERRQRYLFLGAFAYAAVWFAHSPAALLFSPLLGAFVLFLAWRAASRRLLLVQGSALAGALLLAALIWLPGASEAGFTHSDRLREGPLKYSNHYVSAGQFFSTTWGYGVSVAGPADGMPFKLGWSLLILGSIAAIYIARAGEAGRRRWFAFFASAVVVMCAAMTEWSHALWDAVPQLQYVAFPWRLLAPVTFCLALLAATVVLAIERLHRRWRTAAFAAVIALLVLPALDQAKPAGYLSLDENLWTPREIAAQGAVAATFEAFEPRWVVERPTYTGGRIVVTRGAAAVDVVNRTPARYGARVVAASESDLELPLAYFPGWRVRVNGVEQDVSTPSAMGRMRITVPPGDHRIEASFERTTVRWIADLTSLAALLGFATAALVSYRRRSLPPGERPVANR